MKSILAHLILFAMNSFAASVTLVTVESECPGAAELSWIGSAEKGFNIYRSRLISGSDKQFIGSVGPTVRSAVDEAVVGGLGYYYWVEAIDNSSTYMSPSYANADIIDELGMPLSPSAKYKELGNSIEITWNYFDDEDGVNIYRSVDNDSFKLLRKISSSITSSYSDDNLPSGHSYVYKIAGYNECGEGPLSISSNTITLKALPDVVTDSLELTSKNDTIAISFILGNAGPLNITGKLDYAIMINSKIIKQGEISASMEQWDYVNISYKAVSKTEENIVEICSNLLSDIEEETVLNNCIEDTIFIDGKYITSIKMYKNKTKYLQRNNNEIFWDPIIVDQVEIYDLKGRIMKIYKSSDNHINLKTLQNGKYLIKIKTKIDTTWEQIEL